MRSLTLPFLLSLAILTLLTACSRQQQPIVEAVKPMQESVEKAKGVEQTLQNAAETQQKDALKATQE